MKISPARIAAFEILWKIESERAFSSVLLPLYEAGLSMQDRALCHQLTLGILRKQLYLDKIIGNFTKGKKLDPAVRIAARVGLYQLLFLGRIPNYSAINESVNLAHYAKKTSAKGFVNAILRRAIRETVQLQYSSEIERISIETSHPQWLIQKWMERFGIEETERLAVSNNEVPQIGFRFTAKSLRKEATEDGLRKSEYVEGCYLAHRVDDEMLELAGKGDIYFQDEASQMVAGTVDLHDGIKLLDVCAAPGSKATLIAERRMGNAATMVAGDLHWRRVQFLRDNCRKQGVGYVDVLQYDAERSLPFANESFDVVLLDAPCSGTGTIRHNPEIRYFLKSEDIGELSQKQRVLLQNASKVLQPGGRLIYSTCSLEMEENEHVCAGFLDACPQFQRVDPNVHERFVNAEGFAQTYPHRDNMDGFFIASFESVKAV